MLAAALQSPAGYSASDPEKEIAAALALKVRAATLGQLARTYWQAQCSRGVRRCLSRLVRRGLLRSYIMRAHPELPLRSPIWCWERGESEPLFGALSYQLRRRWSEALRPMTVYTASERAGRYF